MNASKLQLTKADARVRAQSWCAYQERSQQEVRDKLYCWSLTPPEVEDVIAGLIADGFLNEERFARSYAGGKFRIKRWGKLKIKQALKLKRVPDKIIEKALKEIPDEDYRHCLSELAVKKGAEIREPDPFKRKAKLVNYLLTKGFENDLIFDVLKANNLS